LALLLLAALRHPSHVVHLSVAVIRHQLWAVLKIILEI
jgi:hypothetical protein